MYQTLHQRSQSDWHTTRRNGKHCVACGCRGGWRACRGAETPSQLWLLHLTCCSLAAPQGSFWFTRYQTWCPLVTPRCQALAMPLVAYFAQTAVLRVCFCLYSCLPTVPCEPKDALCPLFVQLSCIPCLYSLACLPLQLPCTSAFCLYSCCGSSLGHCLV